MYTYTCTKCRLTNFRIVLLNLSLHTPFQRTRTVFIVHRIRNYSTQIHAHHLYILASFREIVAAIVFYGNTAQKLTNTD